MRSLCLRASVAPRFTYVKRYILAPFRPIWRWGMRRVLMYTLDKADLVLATCAAEGAGVLYISDNFADKEVLAQSSSAPKP